MILTIIAFIITLSLLVIAHEFGHFVVAKKVNVKVEEFAIGFPPKLFGFKRGETEYSVNAFPVGGYVKMLGELEHSRSPRAFENQKPGKRFAIAVAGVIMNILLAWVILSIGFTVGMSPLVSEPGQIPGEIISKNIVIAAVEGGSPADQAGIKENDKLISMTSGTTTVEFDSVKQVSSFTKTYANKKIEVKVENDAGVFQKEIVLSSDTEQPLGVAVVDKSIVRVPWYKAPYVGLRETVKITELTINFLGGFFANLFSTGQMSDSVGGPIAIYVYTGLAVKAGIMTLLQFIALLSVNLAIVNILPFPSLDGGRILFIILEKIFGKKVIKEKAENIIHTVGFALLILLILAVTYKDIVNIFK